MAVKTSFYLRAFSLVIIVVAHQVTDTGAIFENGLENISPPFWLAIAYLAYFFFYLVVALVIDSFISYFLMFRSKLLCAA
ncbi:MAG: uncharacterized membrane protein YbhN (UPF0104 family) [Candidatus Azotimanducaceae bacterium]